MRSALFVSLCLQCLTTISRIAEDYKGLKGNIPSTMTSPSGVLSDTSFAVYTVDGKYGLCSLSPVNVMTS